MLMDRMVGILYSLALQPHEDEDEDEVSQMVIHEVLEGEDEIELFNEMP